MDKQLSEQELNFRKLLSELPKNTVIIDSFVKAKSLLKTGKFEHIICSVSGGSDSDLIVDICERLKVDVKYYYMDTGLEYKATKEHITYLEEKYGIKINYIRAKYPVPLAVRKVGQPFLSKQVSEYIHRLQMHDFKWQDKPYEELIKEYPRCRSALTWWCNYKCEDKPSMFNISRNKWLKEFIVANPPTFQISNRCCDLAKKQTASSVQSEGTLNVIGVRKAEGGQRAGHNKCATFGHKSIYRPIFWYTQADKTEYEEYAGIEHSKCYSEYRLKRTGCAGCPFGRDFEYELQVLQEHEPNLYKAVCNIFRDSYEYTRKYKAFCKMKEADKSRSQIGYQMTIFDYLNTEKIPTVKWHPIIDELSADIHKLFKDCDIENESYKVWEHVPNLGKRYKVWVCVKDKNDVINLTFAPLIEKYRRKSLEVSISATGSFKEGYSHSLMISSLWETKGHKEV